MKSSLDHDNLMCQVLRSVTMHHAFVCGISEKRGRIFSESAAEKARKRVMVLFFRSQIFLNDTLSSGFFRKNCALKGTS